MLLASAGVVVFIGFLIALVTDSPIAAVFTSPKFWIPALIAIVVL